MLEMSGWSSISYLNGIQRKKTEEPTRSCKNVEWLYKNP
jgi:hypothetical protein